MTALLSPSPHLNPQWGGCAAVASHGLTMEKAENFASRGLVVRELGAKLGSPWRRQVSLASRGLAVSGRGRGLLPLRG